MQKTKRRLTTLLSRALLSAGLLLAAANVQAASADAEPLAFAQPEAADAHPAADIGYLFGVLNLGGDMKMAMELENRDADLQYLIEFLPLSSLEGEPTLIAVLPGQYFIKKIIYVSPEGRPRGKTAMRAHYVPTAFNVEPGAAYYIGRIKGNSAATIQDSVWDYFEITYWIDKFEQDSRLLEKTYPHFQSVEKVNATSLKNEWQRDVRCQGCD